ncbi:hypothetical protein CRUP_008839 [Coryphaenoides rupestris]|nr:hypothetical protein CRUP_008839 [Coryphaenoides rupestris]
MKYSFLKEAPNGRAFLWSMPSCCSCFLLLCCLSLQGDSPCSSCNSLQSLVSSSGVTKGLFFEPWVQSRCLRARVSGELHCGNPPTPTLFFQMLEAELVELQAALGPGSSVHSMLEDAQHQQQQQPQPQPQHRQRNQVSRHR